MRTLLAFLALILLATPASARYYDADRDGPCYTLKQAKQKALDDYLKYRPKEEGGRCWYRPGKPWTILAKKDLGVAQPVERRAVNAKVAGSMPAPQAIEPVVASVPIVATAAGERAGETFHRVSVSLLVTGPASFAERFEVQPTRWFDMVTPYASQEERREQEQRVSSLAD